MSLDIDSPTQIRLVSPTIEQHPTGFGIGISSPHLSWRFLTENQPPSGWKQTAYELEISRASQSDPEIFRVSSSDSVLVPWPSTPLASREKARVRVRAFGSQQEQPHEGQDAGVAPGTPTSWSPPTQIECGLLNRNDWTAEFIGAADPTLTPSHGPMKPLRFRREFHLHAGSVSQARLYITCLGGYRAFLNGRPVGDHILGPVGRVTSIVCTTRLSM